MMFALGLRLGGWRPPVPATPPSGISVTISPSSASIGTTLTAVVTGDLGDPEATLTYQWSRDGDPISGATGANHVATAPLGDITVTATATNSGGSDSDTSDPVTVTGSAPSGIAVSISPSSANIGDVLTANVTGDYGDPAGTLALQWKLGGSPVSGETASTYTATAAGSVTVTATVTNVLGADSDTSAAVTVSSGIVAPTYDGLFTAQPANVGIPTTYAAGAHFTGGSLEFSIDGSPAGWVIDTGTGVIGRTPAAEGTESVTVRATNGAGNASYTFALTVGPAPWIPRWYRTAGAARLIYDGAGIASDSATLQFGFLVSGLEAAPAATMYLWHVQGRQESSIYSGGQLNIILKDSANVTVINWTSAASVKTAGDWFYLITASLSSPGMTIRRIDLSAATPTWETVAGSFSTGPIAGTGLFDLTRTDLNPDYIVWGRQNGTNSLNANVGMFWLATSSVSESAFFTNGYLRDPATVGSPVWAFRGTDLATGVNPGTGPDFSASGTFTDVAARYAPDAVGPGATTVGARAIASPAIYQVSNLNASGTGSLKAALSAAKLAGGGYVVPATNLPTGWIDSTSGEFELWDAVTYDFSAAPGYNATRGWRTVVKGSNVIVRGTRSAPGAISGAQAADDRDAISVSPPTTAGINHVAIIGNTFAWGADEVMATWPHDDGGYVEYMTVAYNMSQRGLIDSGHSQDSTGAAGHSMGLLYGRRTRYTLTYRNWIAGSKYRFPQIQGYSPEHQVAGNLLVIGETGTELYTDNGTTVALEANTYLIGAHSSGGTPVVTMDYTDSVWMSGNAGIAGRNLARIFASGSPTNGGVQFNEGSTAVNCLMDARPAWVTVTPGTASAEAAIVRAQAGARRGPIEQLLIDADADGYTAFGPLPAASVVYPTDLPTAVYLADTDGDSIPDVFSAAVWEQYRLVMSAHDRCPFGPWRGFPWIEVYFAWRRGEAVGLPAYEAMLGVGLMAIGSTFVVGAGVGVQPTGWTAPEQTSPASYTLSTSYWRNDGNSGRPAVFGSTTDVILSPAATARTSRLIVEGGRHVRMIGGSHVLTDEAGTIAVNAVDITGSIFIDGQLIDLSGRTAECDALQAGGTIRTTVPQTKFPDVYFQNCLVLGVHGTEAGLHADGFQMDRSLNWLRMHMVTVYSSYQWLFLRPLPTVTGGIDLRRCNFRWYDAAGRDDQNNLHPFYLALNDTELASVSYPIFLTDVWIDNTGVSDPLTLVSPSSSAEIGSDGVSPYIHWPTHSRIRDIGGLPGRVRLGTPPGGDYTTAADL